MPEIAARPLDATRYARHLVLPEIGWEGQQRLLAASVLIVGAGGLGSPALLYLAAAGVGRIGIAEFDRVEESNLQRQVLFGTTDIGEPKADIAAARIRAINPDTDVVLHPTRVDPDNARELVRGYDVVLDGSDNFAARYALNDACVVERTVLISGTVQRFEGHVTVLAAPGGPCYRCLFPEPPPAGLIPDCAEGGVVGAVPGVIGSLQATEAIKWITGAGSPLIGRLLMVDTLSMRFQTVAFERDPACPVCGSGPGPAPMPPPACEPRSAPTVSSASLARLLGAPSPPLLIDVREPHERTGEEPPSISVPLSRLDTAIAEVAPDPAQPVVVFCQSGVRSRRAAVRLVERGFGEVRSLEGGLIAWREFMRSAR